MNADLDYNYTPAASLEESNGDVAQVLAIARRVVCQAGAHNTASANGAEREVRLAELDALLERAFQTHALLEAIEPPAADPS